MGGGLDRSTFPRSLQANRNIKSFVFLPLKGQLLLFLGSCFHNRCLSFPMTFSQTAFKESIGRNPACIHPIITREREQMWKSFRTQGFQPNPWDFFEL